LIETCLAFVFFNYKKLINRARQNTTRIVKQENIARTTIQQENRRNPTARGQKSRGNTIRTVKENKLAGIYSRA